MHLLLGFCCDDHIVDVHHVHHAYKLFSQLILMKVWGALTSNSRQMAHSSLNYQASSCNLNLVCWVYRHPLGRVLSPDPLFGYRCVGSDQPLEIYRGTLSHDMIMAQGMLGWRSPFPPFGFPISSYVTLKAACWSSNRTGVGIAIIMLSTVYTSA